MTSKYLKPDGTWHLTRAEVDYINTLSEQIERLTRERDEANATVDRWRALIEDAQAAMVEAGYREHKHTPESAIRGLVQHRDAAEADNDRLRALLKTIHEGFERQVFVRNTDADGDSGWALRLAPYLRALAEIAAELEDR